MPQYLKVTGYPRLIQPIQFINSEGFNMADGANPDPTINGYPATDALQFTTIDSLGNPVNIMFSGQTAATPSGISVSTINADKIFAGEITISGNGVDSTLYLTHPTNNNIVASGTGLTLSTPVGDITLNSSIIHVNSISFAPTTSGLANIGKGSNPWNTIFVDNIVSSDGLTIADGFTTGNITLSGTVSNIIGSGNVFLGSTSGLVELIANGDIGLLAGGDIFMASPSGVQITAASGVQITAPSVSPTTSGVANLGAISNTWNEIFVENITSPTDFVITGGGGQLVELTDVDSLITSNGANALVQLAAYGNNSIIQMDAAEGVNFANVLVTTGGEVRFTANQRVVTVMPAMAPIVSGSQFIGTVPLPYSGVVAQHVITQSPNGAYWKLSVNNAGVVSGTSWP